MVFLASFLDYVYHKGSVCVRGRMSSAPSHLIKMPKVRSHVNVVVKSRVLNIHNTDGWTHFCNEARGEIIRSWVITRRFAVVPCTHLHWNRIEELIKLSFSLLCIPINKNLLICTTTAGDRHVNDKYSSPKTPMIKARPASLSGRGLSTVIETTYVCKYLKSNDSKHSLIRCRDIE